MDFYVELDSEMNGHERLGPFDMETAQAVRDRYLASGGFKVALIHDDPPTTEFVQFDAPPPVVIPEDEKTPVEKVKLLKKGGK
jgi:hypothetical protein